MSALDSQVGGDHYKTMGIQCIEFVLSNNLGFAEGNIVKYVSRHKAKGGLQDLLKARHYLELLLENEAYIADKGLRFGHIRRDHIPPETYCAANGIGNPESGVISHLFLWQCTGSRRHLFSAAKWLQEGIDELEVSVLMATDGRGEYGRGGAGGQSR